MPNDSTSTIETTSFRPAQRIVTQSRAQAQRSGLLLARGFQSPPPGSICRNDFEAAKGNPGRRLGLSSTASQLSSLGFGIESALESVELHLRADVFLAVPCLVVTRSLLEFAATAAWILDANASTDERHARGCATALRAIELSIKDLAASKGAEDDVSKFRSLRTTMINQFAPAGVTVVPRRSRTTGEPLDTSDLVRIGNGSAKVMFNISQRISNYIPLDGVYAILSAVAHGEQIALAAVGEQPETPLRAIAVTAMRSVEAWSNAVHKYVGADPAIFTNPDDVNALRTSFPEDIRQRVLHPVQE